LQRKICGFFVNVYSISEFIVANETVVGSVFWILIQCRKAKLSAVGNQREQQGLDGKERFTGCPPSTGDSTHTFLA
jgi:hypothetical protein